MAVRGSVRDNWPVYLLAAVFVLFAATITRGLWWQWQGILTASPAVVPALPPAPAQAAQPPRSGASQGEANTAPGAPAAPAGAKRPLAPTDEPAPRNTTDKYGVVYDAQGVAVMGIDADPGGVYNVPPGRQLRIGGPSGALMDVGPDGKLTPSARVRD